VTSARLLTSPRGGQAFRDHFLNLLIANSAQPGRRLGFWHSYLFEGIQTVRTGDDVFREGSIDIYVPKVLLVEDNEMNRDMLSRRLARRGFEVVMAVDGEQGVQMAKEERPDLILMDMSLPVLDGWGATRQIKADSSTQSIPLIALTAHAMAGDRDKALQAGCDDYDTKPIELPRLLSKMERLLGQRLLNEGSATLPSPA
jgi:two-component system cell cycle response regulator DivK